MPSIGKNVHYFNSLDFKAVHMHGATSYMLYAVSAACTTYTLCAITFTMELYALPAHERLQRVPLRFFFMNIDIYQQPITAH